MAALPEAPAAATVRVAWRGYDVLLTVRDHDGRRVLSRLDAALAWLEANGGAPGGASPTATSTARAQSGAAAPTCPTHGRPMKPAQRGGWYCTAKLADDDGTGRPVYCRQRQGGAA